MLGIRLSAVIGVGKSIYSSSFVMYDLDTIVTLVSMIIPQLSNVTNVNHSIKGEG